MKKKPNGFIALMSAVIISAVLLQVAVTASLGSFLYRENALDTELKARSSAAAHACVARAFLLIANDPAYSGLTLVSLNSIDICRFEVKGIYPKSIRVQATSSSAAVTNLQINYIATSSKILNWHEVAVY